MTTSSQQESIKNLSHNFRDILTSQNTPDSLGKAIIEQALREAATAGTLSSDGKTIEVPMTMKLTPVSTGNGPEPRRCVSICAYGPGGVEIGCVWICVQ